VYAVFGNKKTLLRELISGAVRGADPETPLIQQAMTRRIAEEDDQIRQIELFATGVAQVLARVAPLMDVVREAAGADEAMANLYRELQIGRRANLESFATALLRNGPLRGNADSEAAGSILWRLASPDLYLLMRNVEGITEQDYEEWLANTLKILLLGDCDTADKTSR
jgi:hypothetical protein